MPTYAKKTVKVEMMCSLPDDMVGVTFLHGDQPSKMFYIWHADLVKTAYDWMQCGKLPTTRVVTSKPQPPSGITCSVPDCDDTAMTTRSISICGAPKRVLPVCFTHADAADEDAPTISDQPASQPVGS